MKQKDELSKVFVSGIVSFACCPDIFLVFTVGKTDRLFSRELLESYIRSTKPVALVRGRQKMRWAPL
jgi:hypothetical protein